MNYENKNIRTFNTKKKKKNRITDFTSNYDSETNTPDVK